MDEVKNNSTLNNNLHNEEIEEYSNDNPTKILKQLHGLVSFIKFGDNTRKCIKTPNEKINESEFKKMAEEIVKNRNRVGKMEVEDKIINELIENIHVVVKDLQTELDNEQLQPTDIIDICDKAISLKLSNIKDSKSINCVEEFVKLTKARLLDIERIEKEINQVLNKLKTKKKITKPTGVKTTRTKNLTLSIGGDSVSSPGITNRNEREKNNCLAVKARLERIREFSINTNDEDTADIPTLRSRMRTPHNFFTRSNTEMNGRSRLNDDFLSRDGIFGAEDYLLEFSSSNNSTLHQDRDFEDDNSGDTHLSLAPFNNWLIDNNEDIIK